jgi:hypothetical protein
VRSVGNTNGKITMSMRQLDRLKLIQAVAEARLKPGRAAERLGLSVRQVERLVLRFRAAGVAGLVVPELAKQQKTYTPFSDICSTSFEDGSLYVSSTRSASGKAML